MTKAIRLISVSLLLVIALTGFGYLNQTQTAASSVSGYSIGEFSFVRGAIDSAHSRERLAKGVFTSAPFLGPARGGNIPLVPDFLYAGDFGNEELLK